MEITLTLHKASEVLPEKSGTYLTQDMTGEWHFTRFSARHQAFNALDCYDGRLEAAETIYWAIMPEVEE